MWKFAGSVWLVLGLAAAAQAAPLGTVTLADGRAHLMRGTTIFAVGEGMNVEEGDMLDLEDGALVQVELGSGSALSFTARAQVLLPLAAGGRTSDLILAAGWTKLNLASAAQVPAVGTPHLRLLSQPASYVLTTGADGSQLFVESGELVPVFVVPKAGQPAVVKSNEYVGVKPDSSVTLAGRAPPSFVAAMPRLYMDKLPQRLAKLKARGVAPKAEREAAFADVDAWFKRYPAARALFVEQFRPLLADKDFVRELEPRLKDYPEWESTVRPEKTRGKGGAKAAPKAKQ
jgi:hypothetical protein